MNFNREKSKEFTLLECNEKKKVEKFGKVILTSFGVVLILFGINSTENILTNNSKNIEDTPVVISDYDRERGEYLQRVEQYRDEFTDINLLDFYNNGKLIVNYNENVIESNIKALYLRYGYINDHKFIFLSNVLNGRNVDFFTNQDNLYAEDYPIIEFRNTTLFEILYKKYSFKITDNYIILNENETRELQSFIYNWDGKINDIVPETMAVKNKQIWEVNLDEKKR